ncbi:Isochorismatase-like protein [Irpex rosettiformis]|uniref:Isochorismatase-like protein n=1 Tax=Irpex rosettiformis TaxID=378272 RepID=A0ACB8UE82_9APHY|nr:Isochorismatase-like protein [Irpex rosettiformis]
MAAPSVVKIIPEQSVILICDLQTRFSEPAVSHFDKVVTTVNKMIKIAKVCGVPVIVTEQNSRALGHTVPEVDLQSLGVLHLATVEKSLFSMCTAEVDAFFKQHNFKSIIVMGIEAHICVLISCLDFLSQGYDVHLVADGVSSVNKEEIPYAFERLRQAGVTIGTSESIAFQLQLDSAKPNFKLFANTIKEEKESTKDVLQTLLPAKSVL